MIDMINNLSDYVLALEQENERLKQQPASNQDAVEEFLRLMAPQMQMYETYKGVLADNPADMLRAFKMAGGKKYLGEENINDLSTL
jgi:hypothetical protein